MCFIYKSHLGPPGKAQLSTFYCKAALLCLDFKDWIACAITVTHETLTTGYAFVTVCGNFHPVDSTCPLICQLNSTKEGKLAGKPLDMRRSSLPIDICYIDELLMRCQLKNIRSLVPCVCVIEVAHYTPQIESQQGYNAVKIGNSPRSCTDRDPTTSKNN